MRDPDVVRWATAELQALRRDLAMSLGLAPPFSPMGVVIRTQIVAIDAELARRLGRLPSRPNRSEGKQLRRGAPGPIGILFVLYTGSRESSCHRSWASGPG